MELEEIHTFLQQHGINKVRLMGTDLDGVLRGKFVSLDKFLSAGKYGFGFCDVLFGWDCQDEVYDFPTMTGWHTGYPDALAKIDLATMRIVPWEPGLASFLVDFWRDSETPLPVCPRNLLKGAVRRAEALGYHPRAAIEYEFWIFQETSHSLEEKGYRNLTPVTPGSFGYSSLRMAHNSRLVHDLYDGCAGMNIGLEGLHTETGPGVYEAAIAVQDAVEAADRAALFKMVVKDIAARHGCTVTFMAKWSHELAGSSGHIHQSLWSEDGGRNLFSDPEAENGMSMLMRHYLGGQLALMGELMPLVCPTINSYKRTVPDAWAPTRVSWGIENRTAAIRVVTGPSPTATRVEYRLAGSDANPYLALAAGLASGLYGIERELEPTPPIRGNAYESEAPRLPADLGAAADRLGQSRAARELFGEEFVSHFARSREWEVRRFQQVVTDWELRRYFEVI